MGVTGNLRNVGLMKKWGDDSINCERTSFPPSRHENWKRSRQRPAWEFTSNASRVVREKIASIFFLSIIILKYRICCV